MTVETSQPAVVPEAPRSPEVEMTDREVLLKTVLDPHDYEYVKEHKLDELFYHDEESGEDGLRHILVGELVGEKRIPRGFHHNYSGERASLEDENGLPLTRVERVVDEKGQETERPLAAPYLAEVIVDGKEKETLKREQKNGPISVVRGVNSMFPQEYDAFTVMRTVEMAVKNAHPSKDDFQRKSNGRWYYGLVGKVPLIDGESEMAVRVVMDYDTMTVVTAYPLLKQSDKMNLTEEQMAHHTTYGLASAAGNVAVGEGRPSNA